jgi:CrcB protein
MPAILLVMLGGAFGSGARYLVSRATLNAFGTGFPWGTLAVNLIGGLVMGLLAGSLTRFGDNSEPWRLLIGVGVLGGFTTFSAFSLDTVQLIERGDWGLGLGYVLASVLGSVAALAIGLNVSRAIA